jgi:hypothetical protein
MHQAAPDQGTWDFDDDGSHVCFGKKVLATLKRLRFEPLFFPERFSENIKGHGVACKQVGRQAGVSPIVSVRFHYLPSVPEMISSPSAPFRATPWTAAK